jgi:hypothetical protein
VPCSFVLITLLITLHMPCINFDGFLLRIMPSTFDLSFVTGLFN